jgi:F0F1-type ATP synthase assembly protein I
MKLMNAWRGLATMLLIGIAAGVLNVLLFLLVSNPLTAAAKTDEIAVNTYVVDFFVGWVFFSAWFLARADDELKKVEEAVHKADRETFLAEVPKRIAASIRVLYVLISALVVLSFHLFHIESALVFSEIQFGVGFLVVTTIMVLWDLDDPLDGVIKVTGVPEDWVRAVHQTPEQQRQSRQSKESATDTV